MFLARLSVFLLAALATVTQGQVESKGEHSDAITMSGNQPDNRSFTDIASLDRQFPIGHDNGATNSGNREVEIPNERLRVAVERELRKESGAIITVADMLSLTELSAESMGISDLTGLEFATGLVSLYFANNEVEDLSPLSGLFGLKTLHLKNNKIIDLSPLSGLIELDWLFLSNNKIANLLPLKDMSGLKGLTLSNNEIADITPLLENLDLGEGDFVDLRHNQFKDNLAKVHITVLEGRGVMVLIND